MALLGTTGGAAGQTDRDEQRVTVQDHMLYARLDRPYRPASHFFT